MAPLYNPDIQIYLANGQARVSRQSEDLPAQVREAFRERGVRYPVDMEAESSLSPAPKTVVPNH